MKKAILLSCIMAVSATSNAGTQEKNVEIGKLFPLCEKSKDAVTNTIIASMIYVKEPAATASEINKVADNMLELRNCMWTLGKKGKVKADIKGSNVVPYGETTYTVYKIKLKNVLGRDFSSYNQTMFVAVPKEFDISGNVK